MEKILACSTYSFPECDLEQVLKKIKKMNFRYVDVGYPQVNFQNWSSTQWKKAKSIFEGLGLCPAALTINLPELTSEYYEMRSGAIQLLSKVLYIASNFQVSVVCVVINSCLSPSLNGMLNDIAEMVKDIIPTCQDLKIYLGFEIHPKGPIKNLQSVEFLMNKILSPWIGFTLDTSLSTYFQIDLREMIKVLRDRLVNVHLRDITDHDFFGIPGRGKIDFTSFFRMLEEINYKGPFIIELFKTQENFGLSLESAIVEAKEFLEGLLFSDFEYQVG